MKRSKSFKQCNSCGLRNNRKSLMRGGTTHSSEFFGHNSGRYFDTSNQQANEGVGHNLSITNENFKSGGYTRKRVRRKSKKSRSKSTTKSRKPRKSRKSKRSKSSKKSSKSSKSKRR